MPRVTLLSVDVRASGRGNVRPKCQYNAGDDKRAKCRNDPKDRKRKRPEPGSAQGPGPLSHGSQRGDRGIVLKKRIIRDVRAMVNLPHKDRICSFIDNGRLA